MSPDLSPGAHVHFVAVCGVGTGSLAGLLRQRGYRVTGSDENVYPPMSTFLEGIGIDILPGFSEDHLGDGPDLVVIGNAVSRGNPEAEAVLRRGIPYVSLPQALGRFLIDGQALGGGGGNPWQDHHHVIDVVGVGGRRAGSELFHRRHPGELRQRIPLRGGLLGGHGGRRI